MFLLNTTKYFEFTTIYRRSVGLMFTISSKVDQIRLFQNVSVSPIKILCSPFRSLGLNQKLQSFFFYGLVWYPEKITFVDTSTMGVNPWNLNRPAVIGYDRFFRLKGNWSTVEYVHVH